MQNNSAEFLGRYFLEGLYLKSGSKISGKLLILLVTMMLTKPYYSILRLDGAEKWSENLDKPLSGISATTKAH